MNVDIGSPIRNQWYAVVSSSGYIIYTSFSKTDCQEVANPTCGDEVILLQRLDNDSHS